MNILFISDNFSAGGLETHIETYFKALKERYPINILFASSFKSQPYFKSVDLFADKIFNIEIKDYSAASILKLKEQIDDIIKHNPIDLIHTHPFISTISSFMSAVEFDIPLAFTLHGKLSLFSPDGASNVFLRNIIFENALGFSVNPSIIPEESNINYLPNPIDENFWRVSKIENTDYALIVSRLDKEKTKAVDSAIEKLKKADIRVVIAGDGSEKKNLEEKHKNVQFVGFKFGSELKELMEQAAFVCGMGRVVLESLFLSKPTVLLNYEGNMTLIDDNTFKEAEKFNFNGSNLIEEEDILEKLKSILEEEIRPSINSEYLKNFSSSIVVEDYFSYVKDFVSSFKGYSSYVKSSTTLFENYLKKASKSEKLSKENLDIKETNTKLKNDIEVYQKEIKEYIKGIEERDKNIERLDGNIKQLIDEKSHLETRFIEMQNENNRLFGLISDIYNSKFWKAAKIWNKIKGKTHSIFKKNNSGQLKQIKNAAPERTECQVYADGQKGRVSIVLPVYNQAEYLEESIESVLNQTYKNFELIVVNDGSTDNVERVLDKYTNHPKVKIITQRNQKLPMALNNGFLHATGEYLTWTSADNVMLPKMIEKLVEFLNKNLYVSMVYGDYQAIDDNGKPLKDVNFRPHNQDRKDSSIIRLPRNVTFENLHDSGDNFIGACFMYRDYVAKIIGSYDPQAFGAEDYDYWMRINEIFGISHLGSDEILYKYRVHKNTLNAKAEELGIFDNVKKLLQRDKERRKWLAEPFKVSILGAGGVDINSSSLSDKELCVYDYKLWKYHITNKSISQKNNIVNLVVLNEELLETDLVDSGFDSADFLITNNKETFESLYTSFKEKLILIQNCDSSFFSKMVEKIANSIFLNKIFLPAKTVGKFKIYTKSKPKLVLETRSLDKGGLEQVVYDLARGISSRNKFDVTIAVMENPGIISEKAKKEGINVITFNGNVQNYKKFLRENKIDIINSHYSNYSYKAGFAGKIVETIHNYYIWMTPQEYEEYGKYLDRADAVVCVSSGVALWSRKKFRFNLKKRHIILNGIDFKEHKKDEIINLPDLNENGVLLVNIGAYIPAKAQNIIVGAVLKIKEFLRERNVKIVCVGHTLDKPYKKNLVKLIDMYDLKDLIILKDFMPREEIYYLMNNADIFLQPSFFEGCSIALMEALSCGKPVIVSDVGSARELVKENVGLIMHPPYDILRLDTQTLISLSKRIDLPASNELANLIKKMISSLNEAKGYSQLRRDILKDYSITKMIDNYERLFQEVLLNNDSKKL